MPLPRFLHWVVDKYVPLEWGVVILQLPAEIQSCRLVSRALALTGEGKPRIQQTNAEHRGIGGVMLHRPSRSEVQLGIRRRTRRGRSDLARCCSNGCWALEPERDPPVAGRSTSRSWERTRPMVGVMYRDQSRWDASCREPDHPSRRYDRNRVPG